MYGTSGAGDSRMFTDFQALSQLSGGEKVSYFAEKAVYRADPLT